MLRKNANVRPLAMAVGFCVILLSVVGTSRSVRGQDAGQILEATGVKGGFVVHLGCGEGKLTAALHANDSYVVQGLDADQANVEKARAHIRSLGLYGKVSADRLTGDRLPYAENLVNLLVVSGERQVAREEIMRVLAPNGVALFLNPKSKIQNPKWIKPHPKNTDEWTHYLHDASGNAVAHDQVVGPPRRVQWIGGPRHSRSHEYTPSILSVVSTGGRIFYIVDEAAAQSLRKPAKWHLVARDAYNGVVLWKRPLDRWFSHMCGWTRGPLQLQRKLIAVGDRVYVTLGFHAPLSAIDAETGKTIQVYDDTTGTEEILCHKGILLLSVRGVTEERLAEFKKWAELETKKESPLHARESADPLVKEFRKIENKAQRTVLALEADTGRVLWRKEALDIAGMRPLSLCAVGDRVFYQKGRNVICLDLKTGKELWSARSTRMRVVSESSIVCADRKTIIALSVEDGKELWTQEPLLCSIRDAFVINGSLWLGGFKPFDTGRKHTGPAWGAYFVTQRDLATGKVLKEIDPKNPGHHHRCYINKATDRYIIDGRRGAEFFDLQTGEVLWHSWVRGTCRYGVMPCNGLLYAPPHACGCYIAAKLTGFYALAPKSQRSEIRDQQSERSEKGPAYAHTPTPPHSHTPQSDDWPMYRHDAARSGCTKTVVPTKLKRVWQADIGGKLSSVTVAWGKVFVASVDRHTVSAVDAESGKPVWSFTAGARVDSPPTVHKGQAIFGCRDGYVYSLRASDGALAWRLRAAREDRRVTVCGQVESVSPVPGSVLIQDGVLYCTAGRSSYLDGGIDLVRIQPETGKVLSKVELYSPDPETGKQPDQYGPCYMPGELEDILTSDGKYVYLRDAVFNKEGIRQEEPETGGPAHLLTLTGFLDDTWPHRSYWAFGTRCSLSTGCSGRDRDLISARLLALDGPMIYGYGRERLDWSNEFLDKPYRLFALNRDAKPKQEGKAKRRRRTKRPELWAKAMPIYVRAMVLTDKVLFVAGPSVEAGWDDDGKQGALLMAISAADGAELARYPLDSAPVFDGMAAANGRLILATRSGRVTCMGKE